MNFNVNQLKTFIFFAAFVGISIYIGNILKPETSIFTKEVDLGQYQGEVNTIEELRNIDLADADFRDIVSDAVIVTSKEDIEIPDQTAPIPGQPGGPNPPGVGPAPGPGSSTRELQIGRSNPFIF